MIHRIMDAKKEETRLSRLEEIIKMSAKQKKMN
jgi:uncharacterized protein YdeI (YjbR/CyaY-like superfamily)